ncbi:hypothetical protein EPN83_03395 [Patescibacteria group bacterium]|nr:MAG: hypothetical protein EPN83_03395 [Patescibacteria group bacterium]
MSGHNKWSKIKRQKEQTDAEKSKLFGKLLRAISVEAKRSGGDVSSSSLRQAIEKARAANVPSDNIERAVRRAREDAQHLEEISYEAYGPGGCALMIKALTQNRNKATQEIKQILSAHGSSLSEPGSAAWAFEKTAEGWRPKSVVPISPKDGKELSSLTQALEESDEVQEVFTNAQ